MRKYLVIVFNGSRNFVLPIVAHEFNFCLIPADHCLRFAVKVQGEMPRMDEWMLGKKRA